MDTPTEINDAALRAQEAEPLTPVEYQVVLDASERFERRYNAVSMDDYPAEREHVLSADCWCGPTVTDYR